MTTKAVMPALIRVRDVMTAEVHGLAHDTSLAEAAQVFRERQISGAPVLSGSRVVGVVSKTDLVGAAGSPQGRVDQVMTKALYAVRAGDPLILALQLMVEEGLHRVLVVADDNQIAGIVTPIDVCRAVLRQASATLGRASLELDYVEL